MIGGDQQLHPHVRLREIVDGVVRLLPDQLDIRAIGDHLTTEINPHPLLAIFDPHATTIHRFPPLETTWINSGRALHIPVGWIQPCPTRSFGLHDPTGSSAVGDASTRIFLRVEQRPRGRHPLYCCVLLQASATAEVFVWRWCIENLRPSGTLTVLRVSAPCRPLLLKRK